MKSAKKIKSDSISQRAAVRQIARILRVDEYHIPNALRRFLKEIKEMELRVRKVKRS